MLLDKPVAVTALATVVQSSRPREILCFQRAPSGGVQTKLASEKGEHARGMRQCGLELNRPQPIRDVRIARAGRVQPRVAVLPRFPGALVDHPAVRIGAVGKPPVDVRRGQRIDLAKPAAVERV